MPRFMLYQSLKSTQQQPAMAESWYDKLWIMMYRIMHELLWIRMFWSWVRWFANDFHDLQIISRVTKRSFFMVMNVLFYSLHAFYFLNTQICQKQSSIAHFAIVTKDGLFWLSIVTSPQLICDITQTRGTSIVMSYSWIVLACTIGAKAMFTNE